VFCFESNPQRNMNQTTDTDSNSSDMTVLMTCDASEDEYSMQPDSRGNECSETSPMQKTASVALAKNGVASKPPTHNINRTNGDDKHCSECGVYTTHYYSLRRHIQLTHKHLNVDELCPLRNKKSKKDLSKKKYDNSGPQIKQFKKEKDLSNICVKSEPQIQQKSRRRRVRRDISKIPQTSLYVCPVCSKILISRGNLRTHIQQIHKSGNVDELCPLKQRKVIFPISEARQNCSWCSKTFNYKQSLKRHIATFHSHCAVNVKKRAFKKRTVVNSSEFSFTCLTCSGMFSTNRCLRQHMRRRHKDGEQTSASKPTRRVLDVEQSETHACSVCSNLYLSRSTLRTHIRNAHDEVDVDAVCVPMKRNNVKCPGRLLFLHSLYI